MASSNPVRSVHITEAQWTAIVTLVEMRLRSMAKSTKQRHTNMYKELAELYPQLVLADVILIGQPEQEETTDERSNN